MSILLLSYMISIGNLPIRYIYYWFIFELELLSKMKLDAILQLIIEDKKVF